MTGPIYPFEAAQRQRYREPALRVLVADHEDRPPPRLRPDSKHARGRLSEARRSGAERRVVDPYVVAYARGKRYAVTWDRGPDAEVVAPEEVWGRVREWVREAVG